MPLYGSSYMLLLYLFTMHSVFIFQSLFRVSWVLFFYEFVVC